MFMSRCWQRPCMIPSPNMAENTYEIYAIRYAHHVRAARENFIAGDAHDESPMPLDYYVWAVKSRGRIFVVDTGFDEAVARQRGRTFVKSPAEGLKALDIDPAQVEDVIIT